MSEQITKLINKAKLGQKKEIGAAVATGIGEGVTQGIEFAVGDRSPKFTEIKEKVLTSSAPFMGDGTLKVRDLPSLAPAILEVIKFATGKKGSITNILASYITKAGLRAAGLNPRHSSAPSGATATSTTEPKKTASF